MRPHAVERLSQRYGIARNGIGVVSALKAAILDGDAKFRRPLQGGRSEWEVYVAGRRIRCVWDEAGRVVVTVLPARVRGPGRRRVEWLELG